MKKLSLLSLALLLCLATKAQTGNQGDPPSQMPGLQITRTDLFKKFIEFGVSYPFSKAAKVDYLPCYMASDSDRLLIKIIGNEDYLRSAEFSLTLTKDTAFNRISLKNMTAFVFVFGYKPGMDWFFDQFKIRNAQPQNPHIASKKFDYAREIKYDYSPSKQQIKITVTPY